MRCGIFMARLYIIVPSWLNVERAIIFFISHSAIAARPATQDVIAAANRRIDWREETVSKVGKNRMRIKTPAVTRVDEWTRAETGVGAAIAAGSHLIKGNCALFVMAATINIVAIKKWEGDDQGWSGSQWVFSLHAIVNRINTSPTRFVMAVIMAAP